MVVHQEARAFELWFEQPAPVDVMQAALLSAIEARAKGGAPAAHST